MNPTANQYEGLSALSEPSVLARDFWAWLNGNGTAIVIAVAVAVAVALLLLAVRAIGCRLIERHQGTALHWRIIFARVVARTRLFFIVMVSVQLVAEYAATPPSLLALIHILFVIAAAFQAAIWTRELVVGLVEHRVGPEADHSTLGSAVGIIRLLVSFALFTIAIIVILDNLGVDVTGLVAGLGIGGIAIGLAAKGIFDDLFSALSIIFDKPFRRGETINWDGTTGTVEEIGLKSTRVRAVSGEEVVISNTNLLGKELRNYARLDHRRITQPFGIVYQTSPAACASIPAIVREIVEAHAMCLFVRCGMVAFGASSLDYEVQYDVLSDDWQLVFDTRHAILIAILERFNRDGIEFAYPTTTNFSAGPDGKMVLPYPPGLEAAITEASSGDSD